MLRDKLTILVSSCDKYEDLWKPFFTLLKKYWDPLDISIILNTESKDFSFDGLNIQCIHLKGNQPYGLRMLNALSYVKTEYVLSLLDDFFIRSEVQLSGIENIVKWMDEDPDIVYFNCDINKSFVDWEVNKYPGFRRLPPGNPYILSMQAAIWRTKMLKKFWPADVNPWEWELLCNANTRKNTKLKYYCVTDLRYAFLNYGYNPSGMGVYRGKWVIDDVKPLFEREGIEMDFSLRGIYNPLEQNFVLEKTNDRRSRYLRVYKCLGWLDVLKYFLFCRYGNLRRKLGLRACDDYFKYVQNRAKALFLLKHAMIGDIFDAQS